MQDLNRVQLIGHLGHDPAVTYTATGTARTTSSVATRARWKDAAGHVPYDGVTDTRVPGSEAQVGWGGVRGGETRRARPTRRRC